MVRSGWPGSAATSFKYKKSVTLAEDGLATLPDLLLRLDAEGRVVKRTKKIYTMILFGIINFTYTWYDPKGAIGPQEFADMAVELFLHGFAPGAVEKAATTNRREKV